MNRFQIKKEVTAECRFCDYMSHGSKNPIDTPWMSSIGHSAFVSIGALVEGWSLIVPKKHALNLSAEYKSTDFWNFTAEAISAVQEIYGKISIFEHGAFKPDSKTSCGTGHAHLHIVPLDFSLFEATVQLNTEMKWEACRAEEIAEKSQGQEYLFVTDSFQHSETEGHICILQQETSQFFRRVIAHKIGKPDEFDYKKFKMNDTSNRSIERLSGHIWKSINSSRTA